MMARKVRRRLGSSRGTAYIEFAVMVPLFLFAFFYAADFTRILYCEQQVEIATRALCDIECHQRPGDRSKGGNSGCPAWHGKHAVRKYLATALKKEGIFTGDRTAEESVYCKASYYDQSGLIHKAVKGLDDAMTPNDGDNIFVNILKKLFGGLVDLLTLKTFRYLRDVVPTDKVVRASVSVLIQPLMPKGAYTFFGRHDPDGAMLIPAVAPRLSSAVAASDRKMYVDRRVRAYCYMPSFDTAPLAPHTYIRQLSKFLKKWLP